MADLSDFIEAIPQAQTALSFGVGFVIGAITRYTIDRKRRWPGGAVGAGFATAIVNRGAMPNYVADVSAALVGDYLGSTFVDRLRRSYTRE